MKRALPITLLIALALTLPAAAQTAIPKPKANEIVFIFKVQVLPAPPTEFFLNYVEYRKEAPKTTAWASMQALNKTFVIPKEGGGPLNAFNAVVLTKAKDGEYRLNSLSVYLASASLFELDFGYAKTLSVPEGVQYVYLGTFVFRYTDEFFTPQSFERIDEFDAALVELKAAYGPSVDLIRATLRDPE